MKIKTKVINAFTRSIHGGNPAGVVLYPPVLTPDQMMGVTKLLSVSETAFVYPSRVADVKVIFYSPVMEIDLCGHATIATFFVLADENASELKGKNRVIMTQETRVGVLPVEIRFKAGVCDTVIMNQGKVTLEDVNWDAERVSSALNIRKNDIDISLPRQRVSTGLFTLPICVRSYSTLRDMKPDFNMVKELCVDYNVGSIHVYTFDTLNKNSLYHARNFAPLYGVNEDPVTGTANGAVSCYLYRNGLTRKKRIWCEQGDIIGRPGRVYVEIGSNDHVKVGGRAVHVSEQEVII
ncbi:MAG: PhzF family phenazine biosynthesis protein [Candidatus Thermoplasmatota archaeon]